MSKHRRKIIIPPGYEVTRDGRVLSTRRGKVIELKTYLNGSGYGYPSVELYVAPNKKWHVAVYRLVAAVHLPPRPDLKHFVLHRDGTRTNSHADNLYWGTAWENTRDAWRHRREAEIYANVSAPLPF